MRARSVLSFALATLAVIAACGSDRPPAEGSSGSSSGTGSGNGGGKTLFNTDDAGATPPGCGVKDDGTACECVDAPLYVDPPTIYFVLDSSGSMAQNNRWLTVRLTVANVMRALGPRANFGATAFPARSTECGPGAEVLPITPGDPPSSSKDGPAVTKLISATAYDPVGGTPTSATLEAVFQRLQGQGGRTFVILATDGAPNCNLNATCSEAQCQPNIEHYRGPDVDCVPGGPPNCCQEPYGGPGNCNDGAVTIAAIAALKSRNIPVYVIGLPGTQFPVYEQLLNQMANAGGTAQVGSVKQYFAVESNNSTELELALKKIAAQITATCTFDLKEAPPDAKLVNVYMDDQVLPQEPVNGWSLSGKSVTLLGSACNRVKSGDVLNVRIIAGCPTIYPK